MQDKVLYKIYDSIKEKQTMLTNEVEKEYF